MMKFRFERGELMPLDLNGQPSRQPDHPDDALLEEARMAASSDWEEDFVADQLKRRVEYGLRFRLTDAQREKLEQITRGDEEDLLGRVRFGRRR